MRTKKQAGPWKIQPDNNVPKHAVALDMMIISRKILRSTAKFFGKASYALPARKLAWWVCK